jgi:hypothetical protein
MGLLVSPGPLYIISAVKTDQDEVILTNTVAGIDSIVQQESVEAVGSQYSPLHARY